MNAAQAAADLRSVQNPFTGTNPFNTLYEDPLVQSYSAAYNNYNWAAKVPSPMHQKASFAAWPTAASAALTACFPATGTGNSFANTAAAGPSASHYGAAAPYYR